MNTQQVIGLAASLPDLDLPRIYRVNGRFWLAMATGHVDELGRIHTDAEGMAYIACLTQIDSSGAVIIRNASEAYQGDRVLLLGAPHELEALRLELNIDPDVPFVATPDTMPLLDSPPVMYHWKLPE